MSKFKLKDDIEVGDVFKNFLWGEVEILGVLKRGLFHVREKDFNEPVREPYECLCTRSMMKDLKLEFIGRAVYVPRKFFKFLGNKRIFIPR